MKIIKLMDSRNSLVILDEMAVMAHTRLCEWLKTSQKCRTHVMCRTSLYSLLSEHKHKLLSGHRWLL